MKKAIIFLVVFTLLLGLSITAYASTPSKTSSDFNPSDYTDEALLDIRDKIYTELLNRREGVLRIGEPIMVSNKYGEYYFTIDNAHVLSGDSWMKRSQERGEDSVCISIQGVIENTSCDWFGEYGYIPNYQIQLDMLVTDQDGFGLEIIDTSSGDDGRYEVGAHTSVGEKKRVSLIYYAFTDTESITVSFKGLEGLVTIPLS